MAYSIKHNESGQRFEFEEDEYLAVIEYGIRDGKIFFTHTGVPPEMEGRGIGTALVECALNYALDNELQIVAICPFVKSYMNRHPEYNRD